MYMTDYNVTIIFDNGNLSTFTCSDDAYILDVAEEKGINMLYSCRAGSCSTCAGLVIEGEIDQSDQCFLDID